jgi:F-type H+-transporting ATPase subunit b
MVQLLNNFGDSSSGIGALGFNGKDFLIQLITFVLAFLILKRYAFGPIIKLLDDRRKTIELGVRLTEDMKKEKAALDEKIEKILHDTRQKADGIIADAQDSARQAIAEAEDKAKEKAAGIVASAEDKIAQDTAQARKNLEKELVGLISEVTEAVIDEKVDSAKDTQLIERALKEQKA